MPHNRKRYLVEDILRDLKWSKIVSVLGMRQVGKTTLVQEYAGTYFSFDEGKVRNQALQEDWSFLEGVIQPIAIDECQIVPGAFSQIKFQVDKSSQPGQFLLTGSVRFLSKKDIRESLTGRTSLIELLPMNLSESHQKPLSPFLSILLSQDSQMTLSKFKKPARFNLEEVLYHSRVGGLPGICFRRDERIRERLWDLHLETILSRDIEMLAPSRLGYVKLRQLMVEVLLQSGLPLNKAMIAKRIGTSGPTVARFLDAFEALFLIKKHGSTYYCNDLGLLHYLLPLADASERLRWIRIVYHELRAQLEYQYRSLYSLGEAKTRGGVDIPFLIEIKKLGKVAITVDAQEKASDKSLKSLTWYKKRDAQVKTVALHLGSEAYLSSAGHLCLPLFCVY